MTQLDMATISNGTITNTQQTHTYTFLRQLIQNHIHLNRDRRLQEAQTPTLASLANVFQATDADHVSAPPMEDLGPNTCSIEEYADGMQISDPARMDIYTTQLME